MTVDSSESLTIKEYPILFWMMGAIFLLVGAAITIGALGGGDVPILMGLIFVCVGLLFTFLLSAITTIQADRVTGTLNLYSWSFFRRSVKEIPFSDLASIEIQSSHSSDGNTYRIVFQTRSGGCVPLHSYYSSGYGEKEKKARRISEFIGVNGPSAPGSALQAVSQILHPVFEQKQEGESSGVHWTLETSTAGAIPVTRWSSPDFRFEGSYLLLMQIPQGGIHISGPKWLGGLSGVLYREVLRMYGFTMEDIPGFESARPFDLPKPGLGDHFSALTNDAYGAQQLITPWVSNLLLDWPRRFPLQASKMNQPGTPGQLAVLYSPQKLYVVSFLSGSPEIVDEMIRLGIGLVKESGLARA